jgi:hypothetical protein
MSNEYLNNRTFEKLIIDFQETKKNKLKYEILHEDVEIHRKNNKDKVLFIPLNQPHEAQKNHLEAQTELAKAFYTLSENIVKYAKFSHIDQDDSIQEGVVICFERAEKFDPAKGKAFNYLTTCILNHFKQLYRAARNYQELKRRISDMYQKTMSSSYPIRTKEKYYKNNNFDND